MKFEKILIWIGLGIIFYLGVAYIHKQSSSFFSQNREEKTELQKGTDFSDVDFVRARFVRVVDGDTLVVNIGGVQERVRLVGVDAPETVTSHKEAECFGEESKGFLARELEEQDYVYLEFDDASGRRDRHGRLLAHVFNHDAQNLNLKIIEQGYAREYTYREQDYLHREDYRGAQQQAKRHQRGFWRDGVCFE